MFHKQFTFRWIEVLSTATSLSEDFDPNLRTNGTNNIVEQEDLATAAY